MIGCPECGGRVAPGRWMCHECERRYLTLLRDVRPTMQALNSLAMKTARTGDRARGGGDGFAPSPIDWGMERLHTELAEWIRGTASHVREKWGSVPLRQWRLLWDRLVANRNTLVQLPEAPDDYRRLRGIMTAFDRASHPGEDMRLAGLCIRCGGPVMCRKDDETAECPACGAVSDVGELGDRIMDRWRRMHVTRTPTGAARWIAEETDVRVSRDVVRLRIKRGTLPAVPVGDGYYEFVLGDLLDIAEEYKNKLD